jgi:hypothetical protein
MVADGTLAKAPEVSKSKKKRNPNDRAIDLATNYRKCRYCDDQCCSARPNCKSDKKHICRCLRHFNHWINNLNLPKTKKKKVHTNIESLSKALQRNVANENNKVKTGTSSNAKSSKRAMRFDLISPRLLERLALRKSVGDEKYGPTQARIGLGDIDYVTDRLNHFLEHLNEWRKDCGRNTKDDHFGAMLWGLDYLAEVEHFHPLVLIEAMKTLETTGVVAEKYNEETLNRRKK